MDFLQYRNKYYLVSIFSLIFVLNISNTVNANTIEEDIFSFEIIGYTGMEGMVGVPYPPNYNFSDSTIPEADTYGYGGLIFRITYQGTTNCKISRIFLWQELSNFGYVYNYSGLKEIVPPGIFYLEGQEYEFLVESVNWPPMFFINSLIKVRIYTEEQGDFIISSQLKYGIEKLESWTPDLRAELDSSFVNLLPLIVGIIAIILFRRK